MPPRSKQHREAVLPYTTINDLFLFRELYKELRKGRQKKEMAEELNITTKKIWELFSAVEKEIKREDSEHGFIDDSLRKKDAQELNIASEFYAGLGTILDDLTRLVNDCKRGHQRIVIQGTEYSILCLLPRILEKSSFLQRNPKVVLDIRRASWPKFMVNLQRGRINLAIGPKTRPRRNIQRISLLRVKRALIFHKHHVFACKKPGHQITLEDLAHETLFVYPGQISWGYSLDDDLPPPAEEGRRIYVDSSTHMYQYVQRDLGVAIGFEIRYAPPHEDARIESLELPAQNLNPAEFFLYFPKDRLGKNSQAADRLRQTIIEFAPALGT